MRKHYVVTISSLWCISAFFGCQAAPPETGATTDAVEPGAIGALAAPTAGGFPALIPSGEPISAALETWTWIDFPDTQCLDGSATGIGVNFTDRSDRLFIFFEGGGACWDYASCWVNGMTANINGYDQESFVTGQPYNKLPLFDRSNVDNPLADASYAYVPYCTGDLHGGSNVVTLTDGVDSQDTYFVGYENVSAILDRLVPTFPDTTRVWLSGWSAGGYGATINWEHIQRAFGDGVRVDVIADSGPFIAQELERWNTWRTAWNYQMPAGCTTCATGMPAIMEHLAGEYDGGHRFSLLSYTRDWTVASYWGITRPRFYVELDALATNTFDPRSSVKYFFLAGVAHVLLGTPNATSNGVTLYDWLDQQVNDDPDWQSVRP